MPVVSKVSWQPRYMLISSSVHASLCHTPLSCTSLRLLRHPRLSFPDTYIRSAYFANQNHGHCCPTHSSMLITPALLELELVSPSLALVAPVVQTSKPAVLKSAHQARDTSKASPLLTAFARARRRGIAARCAGCRAGCQESIVCCRKGTLARYESSVNG